ncbi:nickel/cobalt transporter [Veronia pacifica]|uniref:nickel/cobalt transporter n=1 Tax=Veronia pacifica TaxID=1080227 RepID=UPI001586CF82|nr:hypothetical protein [Veronia pacifica]
MTQVIEWQKTLHVMLAEHISAVSENALEFGGALIALSFGYGVFHAIGPGHGKAVIVTYLGTNKESIGKGIAISLAAAVMQSVIAIILVSALARVLKFKLVDVQNYGNDVALVSYALVILLGAMLIFSSIFRLTKLRQSLKRADSHSQVQSDQHASHRHAHGDHSQEHHHHGHGDHQSHEHHSHDHDGHEHHSHTSHAHSHHDHGAGCGCSHAHVAEENQSIWQTLVVIMSMGFRPCSGAIVVLIYAHLVGVYSYGVIATLMMGLGTGLSVSLIAIATLYARAWLERIVADSGALGAHSHLSMVNYLRLFGGLVLLLLGGSFFSAAFAVSGHPLF